LLNFSYLKLDEFFLLSIYFFAFFLIVYISLKSIFKSANIISIFKKYILFVVLFKINFSYNKFLNFYSAIRKILFLKYKAKLFFFKRFLGLMLAYFFEKHKALISLLLLSFLKAEGLLKEGSEHCSNAFIGKAAFNDSALLD
jgi:hypothetical protein